MYERVQDAAARYEGQRKKNIELHIQIEYWFFTCILGEITGWDVFNEILHDNDWFQRHLGDDIFEKMLAEYRIQNPSGKSAINDYELLRADKGRCFVDRVNGLDIDALGLQEKFYKF